MIQFLQDYTTEAVPPEHFEKGQQIERSAGSEGYFVGRGLAGYLVDGKLVDADYQPIAPVTTVMEIIQPGNRRTDLAVRAGEVMTGQPPRGTSGPGVPLFEAGNVGEGSPAVVLEAELERLTLEVGRLTTKLSDANGEGNDATRARDEALVNLAKTRDELTGARADLQAAREQLGERDKRVGELEGQLAEARAAASGGTGEQNSPPTPPAKPLRGK
jgi:hypothetical protein